MAATGAGARGVHARLLGRWRRCVVLVGVARAAQRNHVGALCGHASLSAMAASTSVTHFLEEKTQNLHSTIYASPA